MTDVFSRRKRSEVMSKIRSKDTKPELEVRRALFRMGCRYRLHVADLPGHPDIVMPRLGLIIEVRGCFWHQHRCLARRLPSSNRAFWRHKLEGNVLRDSRNLRRLKRKGWHVDVIWECVVRRSNETDLASRLELLVEKQRARIAGVTQPRARLRSQGRRAKATIWVHQRP